MADESRNFQVEIITPERVFYTGEATMIEFTTVEGDIGVYKNHIPLTTVLAPGIVTITQEDGQKKAAVHSGFAQILGDKVTLLAEIAEWPDATRSQDRKSGYGQSRAGTAQSVGAYQSAVKQNIGSTKAVLREEGSFFVAEIFIAQKSVTGTRYE